VLDLTDLRVFLRTADLGSVSAVARDLDMPKSSVSRSLSRLEGEVGSILIDRSTRRFSLTDAGAILHRHGRRIIAEVDEAEHALRGYTGVPAGDMTVAAAPVLIGGLLSKVAADLINAHPGLNLTIVPATVGSSERGETDVRLEVAAVGNAVDQSRVLGRDELWLVGAPSIGGIVQTVDGLADAPVVFDQRRARWLVGMPGGATREFSIEARLVVQDGVGLRDLLLAGSGVGLAPRSAVAGLVERGLLARLLPDHAFGELEVTAALPAGKGPSARVRVLLDAIADALGPDRLSRG